MTTKHEIEIEGLPEGWQAVAFRVPVREKDYILLKGKIHPVTWTTYTEQLIVEKIKPRRIVLEEVTEGSHDMAFHDLQGDWTYWRIVKEE